MSFYFIMAIEHVLNKSTDFVKHFVYHLVKTSYSFFVVLLIFTSKFKKFLLVRCWIVDES